METLVQLGLNNALVAALLAIPATLATLLRRPALAHGLWLLVLVKLLTPPLFGVPLVGLSLPAPTPRSAAVQPDVAPVRLADALEQLDPSRLVWLPPLGDDALEL